MPHRGVERSALANAVGPDDRMVVTHSQVAVDEGNLHLRRIGRLVEGCENLNTFASRARFKGIPLVSPYPSGLEMPHHRMIWRLYTNRGLLKLWSHRMPHELRTDQSAGMLGPIVGRVASRSVNAQKASSFLNTRQ